MKTRILYALFILLIAYQLVQGQDSLLREDLSSYVYHFDLKEGQINGQGADLLKDEAMKSQYFLIGEYHGSRHISNLTKALIPILDQAGYQHFGIEVGPHSAQILQELSEDVEATAERLNAFNEKYGYIDQSKEIWTPIPFFENDEDAQFLATAIDKNWNLFGLDQEFCYGYIPLIDRMFEQLSLEKQQLLKVLHQQTRDSIQHYYKMDDLDKKRLAISMTQSEILRSFLSKASDNHPENGLIADAIRTTNQIYYYNATRKYLDCNSTRIDYMKENLSKALKRYNFDLETDKLLLKMGGIHTAKGFSWLSLYELGNSLHELANFHGNRSVHLTFFNRFYEEKNKEIDALSDETSYAYRYLDLLQFGQKDRWTVIDLRPLKEKIYYHRKYEMSDMVKDIFRQHDLFVIPPMEKE